MCIFIFQIVYSLVTHIKFTLFTSSYLALNSISTTMGKVVVKLVR